MKSKSRLHLGTGTIAPDVKRWESQEIEDQIAVFFASGKKIEYVAKGVSGRKPEGHNRGARTVAQRTSDSKKRQAEGPEAAISTIEY